MFSDLFFYLLLFVALAASNLLPLFFYLLFFHLFLFPYHPPNPRPLFFYFLFFFFLLAAPNLRTIFCLLLFSLLALHPILSLLLSSLPLLLPPYLHSNPRLPSFYLLLFFFILAAPNIRLPLCRSLPPPRLLQLSVSSLASTKSLRTPSNMFVINLALMDFIMMLKTPVFVLNSFNDGPVWGKTGCDIFGLMGAFSGVGAASCNAVIAYDRYKTIAKPFEAKFSRGTAIAIVVVTWLYALPWTIMPYLEVWGRFVPEGFLTSCTFDYMTEDSNTKSFVATIFFFAYCVPSSIIFFCYSQIFGHVSAHEKAMRAQAKRMNVTNFRSVGTKEEQEKSAEIRIAKVAITIFFLFSISWVPYATVALIAAFGNRALLTPLVAMIPACTCKTVACLDPWVYAINHPKYRLELMKRMPWFCVHEEAPSDTASASTTATKE